MGHLSRRTFVRFATVGALSVAAAQVLPFSVRGAGSRWEAYAESSFPVLDKAAYGFLYGASGLWNNPEPRSVAIPAIISSGAKWVRAGNGKVPAPSVAKTARDLIKAGIGLGVRYNPFTDESLTTERPLTTIHKQTSALFASGFYAFLILDHALQLSNPQTVVDTIKSAGFNLIATNETSGEALPPTGVWQHQKAFGVMNGADYLQRIVNYPDGITPRDANWITSVKQKDPGSYAVLKLENTSETTRFAGLDLDTQVRLLTAWAQSQQKYGYRTYYPLFTAGTGGYDSIKEGTYQTQVNLLGTYG